MEEQDKKTLRRVWEEAEAKAGEAERLARAARQEAKALKQAIRFSDRPRD